MLCTFHNNEFFMSLFRGFSKCVTFLLYAVVKTLEYDSKCFAGSSLSLRVQEDAHAQKTQETVGIAKQVNFISHFCINTYQPLDIEATEKEMEHGARAGGAAGRLCTFRASPG